MQPKTRSAAATLARFSLPLIMSGVLQQLYSWADAFVVGHVMGDAALAGISAASTITNFLTLAITGFTLGLSILAARRYGEGKTEQLAGILSSFTVLLAAAFALLAALGAAFARPLALALDTPADMLPYTVEYLSVVAPGVPFLAVYNTYAALLRAMGDSRTPFWAVVISSATNVVLDILLVAVLPFGAAGAAAATVVSQAAMTVFIVAFSVASRPLLRFRFGRGMVRRELVRAGFSFAVPPAVQSSVTALGSAVLQGFMNGFGSRTVAAITTAYRVDSVMLLPIVNLGAAISTMIAQSAGAADPAAVKRYFRTGVWMELALGAALALLMPLAGSPLIALFGIEPAAVEIGRQFFVTLAPFYLCYSLSMSFRGAAEGLGRMLYSSLAGLGCLGVRIVMSYAFAPALGNGAIAAAEIVSWLALLAFYLPFLAARRRDLF